MLSIRYFVLEIVLKIKLIMFVPNYVAGLNGFGGTYATVITFHIVLKFTQRGLSLFKHLELPYSLNMLKVD